VDARGKVIRLLGVNRSGAEYMCLQTGGGLFDGPTSIRSIRAMKRWHIDAVRVPLNESCWLGINGVPRGGRHYRHAVTRYVERLHSAGLDVVLDLHWAAPGKRRAVGIIPMADADHAPAFWHSVATRFRSDHAVLFDLYNEPHNISWRCWRSGCRLAAADDHPAYRTAGMQRLVNAVRATGATQPIMVGGLDWASDLRRWLTYRPHDPLGQLVASEHNFGRLAPCATRCRHAISAVARRVPVVVGELGETDCAHGYLDDWMRYADRHGISYLGWTWNATAPGSWTCRGGPSLIRNWAGAPTRFGGGFRRHLRDLALSQ
jgi:hypothetical protein